MSFGTYNLGWMFLINVFYNEAKKMLTVSPEHPVLYLVRHGDTGGFHLFHKGVVQSGRWHGIAGQDGL